MSGSFADAHSGNPAPRLPRYVVCQTSSEEEARQTISRLYHEVELKRTSRVPFTVFASHVALGGWGISYAQYLAGYEISSGPTNDSYILQLPVSGHGETAYGRQTVELAPHLGGTLVSPHEAPRWLFGDRLATFSVRIERQRIESYLNAFTGGQLGVPVEFEPQLQADGSFYESLLRMVLFIVDELEQSDSLIHAPVVLASLEEALLRGILARQPHSHSRWFEAASQELAPAYVRRAAEFLDAHCEHPLQMPDVANAVGVSLRALQQAFRQTRGVSLTQFLRDLRLRRARKQLLSGAPGLKVTAVALSCGFAHLGKFSTLYRKQFGETPSATLNKSRGNVP